MRDDKIQTGLRIQQKRYDELVKIASRSGMSINAVILFLIDVGLSAVSHGVEIEARSFAHRQKHKDE